METIQSGYEKRFEMLIQQNQSMEHRMAQQELQLKKYKAKLKALSDPTEHGARRSSNNRHQRTGTGGDRPPSNQRTRSQVQQHETSSEKQVLAAHQITFNQNIVVENGRKADFPVPISEDGHQSISSATFHQRESNHMALPITTIQGPGSHHSHLISQQQSATAESSNAKQRNGIVNKRSESHDTVNDRHLSDNHHLQA